MSTNVGQSSEDTELIRQTEQQGSVALLQTTNPFPEAQHNARWTSIRQSFLTMHDSNRHLPCLWPIVMIEAKPSPCQILTSLPVQSKAVPEKQRRRQWQLMPGGQGLWAAPSYLCPSSISSPFFVRIGWQKIWRAAALALCHSGTQRQTTLQKKLHTVHEQQLWKEHL